MAFNGNEGEMIDSATAQRWIDNYKKNAGPAELKWAFYGFRKISELFGQDNAIGVRIYLAKDDSGTETLVLVAADEKGQNIAPIDGSSLAGLMLDRGHICPPYCTD